MGEPLQKFVSFLYTVGAPKIGLLLAHVWVGLLSKFLKKSKEISYNNDNSIVIARNTVLSWSTGLHSCLNNEDCLGAHRLCHRNLTMRVGVCVCAQGFRPALQDAVKCLNVGEFKNIFRIS